MPGPAVLYIVARSLDQGRLAGLASVLGIETGNFLQVLTVTMGLSAVLLSSALAFSIVKYLGAAYLIYLGVRRFLSGDPVGQSPAVRDRGFGRIFRQGVIVAVLNPKTALFFLAFLPQFVDASKGSIALQLLTLGCLFVMMATVTDGMYALLAGTVGQFLKGKAPVPRAEKIVVGGIYIGLGVMAALADIGLHLK
jgi:threonine/homoserine/homoserine lactone efflux protein